MRTTVTGIKKNISKYGGHFYYIFFKNEEGISLRSCLDPKMGNFSRWEKIIEKAVAGEVFEVDNLIQKGNIIDADSFPKIIEGDKNA